MFRVEIGSLYNNQIVWAVLEDNLESRKKAEEILEEWQELLPQDQFRIK